MLEMGQHSYHLILMSESGDERTDGLAAFQVVEQFELILYPYRAACNIDLLDSDVSRVSMPS